MSYMEAEKKSLHLFFIVFAKHICEYFANTFGYIPEIFGKNREREKMLICLKCAVNHILGIGWKELSNRIAPLPPRRKAQQKC
jgi:hypothetical protein